MQITCEKCGTVYALDDRLIPAGGAPVQCTRCGNVFTARPTAAAAPEPTRRTMVLFPNSDPPGPAFDRTPAPAPRPAPSEPPLTTEAKVALGKTLLQFPAIQAPAPTPAAPTPRPAAPATPTRGTPAASAPIPEGPTQRVQAPTFPPRTPTPRTPGTPAIGAHRPPADAMAKTLLGAQPFGPPGPAPVQRPAPAPAPVGFRNAPRLPGLQGVEADIDRDFERQLAARPRRAAFVGLGIFLGIGILAGIFALRNRPPPVPAQAVRECDEALGLMKRDDTESLNAAAEAFATVSAQVPAYAPAGADRLIALSLVKADLKDEIQWLDAKWARLDHERDSIEKKEETADWRARVKEKIDQMAAVKAKADPLKDRANDLSTAIADQLKVATQKGRVEGAEDPTLVRALAVHYALEGDERAEKLALQYRQMPDPGKGFDDPKRAFADLTVSALAAYGHHSPERMKNGEAAARQALANDDSLLRAQFVLAKMAFAAKDYSNARSTLDALLIQNPKHDAGKLLKEEIEAAEATAARPAPAP